MKSRRGLTPRLFTTADRIIRYRQEKRVLAEGTVARGTIVEQGRYRGRGKNNGYIRYIFNDKLGHKSEARNSSLSRDHVPEDGCEPREDLVEALAYPVIFYDPDHPHVSVLYPPMTAKIC